MNMGERISISVVLFLILISFVAWLGNAAPAEDEVVDLPGLPYPPPFRHYSGYLNATDGRKFHYWFVECEVDPATAPLFLWMNGGPGCSSVDGLLAGNGPFHVNSDSKTLYYNQYSWNKVANVIYLETPAGVGFSYSESKNYSTNDDQTAQDNYAALLEFFDKFPEFSTNDFYITGESYAGVYIPTLASLVLNGSRSINLKAIAVGNGEHDAEMNTNSAVLFGGYHGLISQTTMNKLLSYCCLPTVPPTCHFYAATDETCNTTLLEAVAFVLTSRVNPYSIYSDCESPYGLAEFLVSTFGNLIKDLGDEELKKLAVTSLALPCQSSVIEAKWINQPDVRHALHISDDVQIWKDCNSIILDTYEQQYITLAPFYHSFLPKISALLYNGDTDVVCNFIGGEWFADSLGQEVLSDYTPWVYNNQTAGFVKEYTNLTYATVLGSGHMVPTDKPAQILYLIENYLLKN